MPHPEYRLTTVDNPYNPFTQLESWFLFDSERGYNSCGYLARIAQVDSDMSDDEYNAEVERAIDEIIKNDFTNLYKKVKREDYKSS